MNAYFFKPIFQERIWGAQNLNTLFGRTVPEGKKIGESWSSSTGPRRAARSRRAPAWRPTVTTR